MTEHESQPKKYSLKLLDTSSLKFRIILSLLVLIGLFVLVLAVSYLRSEHSPIELLLVAVVSFLAAIGVGLFIVGQISRRINRVITAAEQVARGDLTIHIEETSQDEFGRLARAFNQTLERLERLFQAQQRLMADVSHELRTPLTAVRGNIDLMRRMGEADPESLTIIQEEVDRMARLVGDLLLKVSRMELFLGVPFLPTLLYRGSDDC